MESPPLRQEKDLKFHIPESLRLRLHAVKILHGQSIRATLVAALDAYFRARTPPTARPPAPPPAPDDAPSEPRA